MIRIFALGMHLTFSEVAVLLVLLVSMESSFGQYLNCGMGHIEWIFFRGCDPHSIFKKLFDDIKRDGIASSDEFLTQLGSVCSNRSSLARHNSCVNNVVSECWRQAADIESYFARHLALFCEGNDVSAWLKTSLQNGFSFDKECSVSEVFGNITTTRCGPAVQAISQINQNITITFASGMAVKQRLGLDFLHCLERVVSEEGIQCGSSWQDALLTHWLDMTSGYPFLYVSGYELAKIKIKK